MSLLYFKGYYWNTLSCAHSQEYMPSLVKNLCRNAGLNLIIDCILLRIKQITFYDFYW